MTAGEKDYLAMPVVAEEVHSAIVNGFPFETITSQLRKNKTTDDSIISYMYNSYDGQRSRRVKAYGQIQRMVVHHMSPGKILFFSFCQSIHASLSIIYT